MTLSLILAKTDVFTYFAQKESINIVITGATKGIGKAIAKKFAAHQFNLAICARSATDLQKLKDEFAKDFPTAQILTHPTDMSQRKEVEAFANFILKEWQSIDVLVNNAGVFLPGEILKEELGTLEQQMNTNLYSAYHLSRALAPTMIKQKSGYIFNMCSIASKIAYPNGGSYSISKFALYGFSKVLREELKDKGVRVSAILPGATWSASWEGADFPASRLMQATDIAEAIWAAWQMSPSAVMEEIILRPQLGDL